MKKILYIFIYLLTVHSVKAQEEGFFGGIEAGLSTTKINIDTLSTKFSFSPLIGFSFQKQIVPKLYIGLATTFTQKNATISSPSLKYQLNYLDWKLSLQYKLSPSLFIEGGAAVSQFIGGRKKIH